LDRLEKANPVGKKCESSVFLLMARAATQPDGIDDEDRELIRSFMEKAEAGHAHSVEIERRLKRVGGP
jgi:Leu/Phe-tRNA-protein transferase